MSTQTRDLLSLATGYFPDLSSRAKRGICFYSKLETPLDLSSLAPPLRRRGGSAFSSHRDDVRPVPPCGRQMSRVAPLGLKPSRKSIVPDGTLDFYNQPT